MCRGIVDASSNVPAKMRFRIAFPRHATSFTYASTKARNGTMTHTIGCTTRPYSTLSFAEACTRIAAAGYTDVAVFRNEGAMPVDSASTPAQIKAARAAAAGAGLAPSMIIGRTQLNLGLAEAVDDYRRMIDNSAALGARWLLDCGVGNAALYEDYLELMRQCAPHAQAAGVAITMKPHGGISLTTADLLRAHRAVAHPAFGICYDPGNIIYYTKGERRPEEDVVEAVPVSTVFIVKDCVVQDGTADVNVTAGDGLVDFPTVLGAFATGGFCGPLYVECVGSKEPAAVDRDIAFTLGYVKGILASAQPCA
jgi:sugar phosphate isomerase/epimerase